MRFSDIKFKIQKVTSPVLSVMYDAILFWLAFTVIKGARTTASEPLTEPASTSESEQGSFLRLEQGLVLHAVRLAWQRHTRRIKQATYSYSYSSAKKRATPKSCCNYTAFTIELSRSGIIELSGFKNTEEKKSTQTLFVSSITPRRPGWGRARSARGSR